MKHHNLVRFTLREDQNIPISYVANIIADDDLVTQGASASAAMILL